MIRTKLLAKAIEIRAENLSRRARHHHRKHKCKKQNKKTIILLGEGPIDHFRSTATTKTNSGPSQFIRANSDWSDSSKTRRHVTPPKTREACSRIVEKTKNYFLFFCNARTTSPSARHRVDGLSGKNGERKIQLHSPNDSGTPVNRRPN